MQSFSKITQENDEIEKIEKEEIESEREFEQLQDKARPSMSVNEVE